MPSLAISLRRQLGRTVEDHTQLKGEFDFELVWDRDETGSSTVPSLFAALQDNPGCVSEPQAGRFRRLLSITSSVQREIERWLFSAQALYRLIHAALRR